MSSANQDAVMYKQDIAEIRKQEAETERQKEIREGRFAAIEMMCQDIISCTEEAVGVDHRARIKISAMRIKELINALN